MTTIIDRDAVINLYRRHVNSGIAKLSKVMGLPIEVRSKGSQIYDEHDQAYLDCGGYGVFFLGHSHPKVVKAVKAQLEQHALSTKLLLNSQLALAAECLASVTPPGLDYVFFTNSGAEAVEAGLKLARLNGKHRVISTYGGYHGKTLGALSVTGRPSYQTPFLPLLPEIEFVPYGNASAIRQALARNSGNDCCVIIEPIQAEGGVTIPPDGYLQEVREACDIHGALLIIDEIQTGLGRLGMWWGCEREGVIPDILLCGKILSGGTVPVAAVVASDAVFSPLNRDPVLHTSTYSGNPLAMAAVIATIQVIKEEGLVEKARRLGEYLLIRIRKAIMETCSSLVNDVRGRGLLIGIEFVSEGCAGEFITELIKRRVIVSHSLNAHKVVRLTPPAILTDAECDWLVQAIYEAGRKLSAAKRP